MNPKKLFDKALTESKHELGEMHYVGESLPVPNQITDGSNNGSSDVGQSPIPAREDHTHAVDLSNYYTQAEVDGIAISGTPGNTYYTDTQIDNILSTTYYTQTQIDALFAALDYYTQAEVNALNDAQDTYIDTYLGVPSDANGDPTGGMYNEIVFSHSGAILIPVNSPYWSTPFDAYIYEIVVNTTQGAALQLALTTNTGTNLWGPTTISDSSAVQIYDLSGAPISISRGDKFRLRIVDEGDATAEDLTFTVRYSIWDMSA